MSAKLTVEIGAVITELQRGLSDAQAQIGSFANKAGARMKKLSEDIGASGVAMSAGVTVPLTAMAAASIKAFGEIESLKKGLIAVSGSAAAADKQFESLTEVAKLPGLGLNEAVKGAIRLQTIGFSAEQAKQSLMVFGNAIATVGGGRDELERAIYGLQQLANTEFPLGEDLNIIKDAIPQVTPLLKEAFGTARTEDLQKLGITSKQVVDTITKGLAALPPVAGGVKNAFENLSDSSTQAFAKIGEVLNERLNLTGMINALGDAIGGVVDWFTNLDPIVQDIILGVAALVAAIGPLLVAFQGVVYIAPILGAAITAIGGPFTILAAVVGVVAIAIIKNWDRVKAFLLDSAATILNNLAGFVGKIANLADKIGLDSVAEKFRSYADAISGKSKEMSDSSQALTATLKEVTDTTKAATDANNKKADSLNRVTVNANKAAAAVKTFGEASGIKPIKVANNGTGGVANTSAPSTTNLIPDMNEQVRKSTELIPGHLNGTMQRLQEFNQGVSDIINNGLVNALSGVGEAIGAAFANGSNVAQALGQTLLSTLGGVLSQLGQLAIATGVAMESIKAAFKSLGGAGAIAAGVALMALAGVVKGKVAKMGNSFGSGGTGSGGGMSMPMPNTNYARPSNTNYGNTGATGGFTGGGVIYLKAKGPDLIAAMNAAGKQIAAYSI